MSTSEQQTSIVLFALGIASLIGSKLGGILADSVGVMATLVGGMIVQAISLTLISTILGSTAFTMLLFMLWAIAAFTFMPVQTLHLITIAPEASGIMLSLNGSFVQFGFAAGAGVGGLIMGGVSIMAIGWAGALSISLAAIVVMISAICSSPLEVQD